MENSKIAWTDHTFNPWIGCTKVSPGCVNCYAKTRDDRHLHSTESHWGPGARRQITSDANWRKPIKWDRDAAAQHTRARVFCASLADVFDSEAPEGVRERIWELIRCTPHLDWLLLTKRAKNICNFLPEDWCTGYPNVWLGVSCEDRKNGYPRVDVLRTIPAVKRFVSCEPLLEDIRDINLTGIDWVIVGGESGKSSGVRVFDLAWARNLKAACNESETNFFVKQMGSQPVQDGSPFPILQSVPGGNHDRDGRCLDNFPTDLQVQEMPNSGCHEVASLGIDSSSRQDDYRQRGLKAAETRRRNAARNKSLALAATPDEGVSGEEFARMIYWLQGYSEGDAGVLSHLAECAIASLTGMIGVLADLEREE
jgi:protein gp37